MIYYVTKYSYNGEIRFLINLKIIYRNMRVLRVLKGDRVFLCKLPKNLSGRTFNEKGFYKLLSEK